MPTIWEWMALFAIWFAWLWLPILFAAIVMWRKKVTPIMAVCFAVAEIAAIYVGIGAFY